MNSHPVCSQTINIEDSKLENEIEQLKVYPVGKKVCLQHPSNTHAWMFGWSFSNSEGMFEIDNQDNYKLSNCEYLSQNLYNICKILKMIGEKVGIESCMLRGADREDLDKTIKQFYSVQMMNLKDLNTEESNTDNLQSSVRSDDDEKENKE